MKLHSTVVPSNGDFISSMLLLGLLVTVKYANFPHKHLITYKIRLNGNTRFIIYCKLKVLKSSYLAD